MLKFIISLFIIFGYAHAEIPPFNSAYDYEENTSDPTLLSYFYDDSVSISHSVDRMEKLVEFIYFNFDCSDDQDLFEMGYDLDAVLRLLKKEISSLKDHLSCDH